jgi:hypothetical protein
MCDASAPSSEDDRGGAEGALLADNLLEELSPLAKS